MSVIATALDPGTYVAAEGVFDWVNSKGNEAQTATRTIASVVCTMLIVYVAVSSRGAIGKIIGSVLVAGIVLAAIWKITTVKDKVGDELDDTQSYRGPVAVQVTDAVAEQQGTL